MSLLSLSMTSMTGRAAPMLGAVWILIALSGCVSASGAQAPASESSPAAKPTPEAQTADDASDLEALYWARQDSARSNYTEADVAFMTGMIGHHAQALVMSRLAPKNGAGPAVQRLAARIINAQRDEIASMQRWLQRRGEPVPQVHIDGLMLTTTMGTEVQTEYPPLGASADAGHHDAGHHDAGHHDAGHHDAGHHDAGHHGMGHGGMDHSLMAGMLTQAELEELAAARGTHFDRLFLTGMIRHHGGAVTMVETLLAEGGATGDDASFKLASDINVDQQTEIERMRLMLENLPDTD